MSEWIKFEKATPDKPEIHSMAAALGIDPDAVVGKCLRVWSWFDTHSTDGNAPVTVRALLDRVVGVPGFCAALISVGWMIESDGDLSLPDFSRHNGEPAKKRAQTRDRAARKRKRDSESNAESNAPSVTPALLEIEGERERVHTHSPRGREADTAPADPDSSPPIPRPGFPGRQQVLDHAAAQGWDLASAANFWLHHDARRSEGEGSYPPTWHWWSKLEKWVLHDAAGQLGRGPGTSHGRGPVIARKPTIADYDRPEDWTDEQMTLS